MSDGTRLDLSKLSAAGIRDGIAGGTFSAREVTEAAFARVDAVETDVHAFLQLTPELAYEAASRVDAAVVAARTDGLDPHDTLPPLAGVPVGFKDNMNLVGTNTTAGSKILGPYESVYTCTAVQRMLDAGAVPIGKCNLDEFAFVAELPAGVELDPNPPVRLLRHAFGEHHGRLVHQLRGTVNVRQTQHSPFRPRPLAPGREHHRHDSGRRQDAEL